jgi:hypothetical protein
MLRRIFYSTATCVLASLVAFPAAAANAQSARREPPDTALFRTIASMDSALFDSYNRCDLPRFASFIADSVEFYHDQTGLMVGVRNLTEAIRQNICGKVVRELVPGTLEVYPMKNYGAVEIGVHRFHPPGAKPGEGGDAQFVHLWQNNGGAWKITRVISFDHH